MEAAGTPGWGDLGDAGTRHAGTPGLWRHEGRGDTGDVGTLGTQGWQPGGCHAPSPTSPSHVGDGFLMRRTGGPQSLWHPWVPPAPGDIVRQRASPHGAEVWCTGDAGGPAGCRVGWHHAGVPGTSSCYRHGPRAAIALALSASPPVPSPACVSPPSPSPGLAPHPEQRDAGLGTLPLFARAWAQDGGDAWARGRRGHGREGGVGVGDSRVVAWGRS